MINICLFWFLVYFLSIFSSVFSLQEPGRLNPRYKIINYYGSRYLCSYFSSSFAADSPTLVYWSNGFFIHPSTPELIYIADPSENAIKIIKDKVIHYLIGKKNKSGFRNGDAENGELNKPSALVVFNSTSFPNNELGSYFKPFLFKSSSQQCIYATATNYTTCLNSTFPKMLNNSEIIDRSLVKMVYFGSNQVDPNKLIINYMFIADSGNHCIRLVNLITAEITTYAGKCTEKGFKDGPKEEALFNMPTGLGIDAFGNLFIYDSGNGYMRMVDTEGFVHTLIQGACFEYFMQGQIINNFGYDSILFLCFRNWKKVYGKPKEHIYDKTEEEVCYEHITKCGEKYYSNLNYQKRANSS